MSPLKDFYVYARRGAGQYRFLVMADSHDAARAKAEAEGHVVAKVRRVPNVRHNTYRRGVR